MKLNELIKKIPQNSLLEVVGEDYRRAWYGEPYELGKFELNYFKGMEVICIDSFVAEVGEQEFRTAIQVKIHARHV